MTLGTKIQELRKELIIFSQILVWLNVIVMLYKFLKQKVKSEK